MSKHELEIKTDAMHERCIVGSGTDALGGPILALSHVIIIVNMETVRPKSMQGNTTNKNMFSMKNEKKSCSDGI